MSWLGDLTAIANSISETVAPLVQEVIDDAEDFERDLAEGNEIVQEEEEWQRNYSAGLENDTTPVLSNREITTSKDDPKPSKMTPSTDAGAQAPPPRPTTTTTTTANVVELETKLALLESEKEQLADDLSQQQSAFESQLKEVTRNANEQRQKLEEEVTKLAEKVEFGKNSIENHPGGKGTFRISFGSVTAKQPIRAQRFARLPCGCPRRIIRAQR